MTSTVSANHTAVETEHTQSEINYGQNDTDELQPIFKVENGVGEMKRGGSVKTDIFELESNIANTKNAQDNVNPKTITIPHDQVHIRQGPSTDYKISHYVDKGTTFKVTAESKDWYAIQNDDISKGYVYKPFIEETTHTTANSLSSKTIVIDAGHGGKDAGAIGSAGSLEKHFTLRTSRALDEKLEMLGANPKLTRNGDEYMTLSGRASLSNTLETDAFISLHYNSMPELPNARGISTYYYHDNDERFASYIQEALVVETEDRDRNVSFGNFQVIRQNMQPAVLIELGFISNHKSEELLLTNAYQSKLINGIISGLEKYFTSQ